MNIIAIDLGTTNIKVISFDQFLNQLHCVSEPVDYYRSGDFIEFDPISYFSKIFSMICTASAEGKLKNGQDSSQIILTGQAESLVSLNKNFQPSRPGISWMDMRSQKECDELKYQFSQDLCYHTTGQPELIPTWPITKILWIKHHEPDVFRHTAYYLLIKDYITYMLCGKLAGDQSVYSFSHYFNIIEKTFWKEILDYCGIHPEQLPPVFPSGTIVGTLLSKYVNTKIGLTSSTKINIGTLDHFAGMIGTGSISPGQISESAGTVLSIATLSQHPVLDSGNIPNYCGPFPNSYVLLPVCESGGFSMEWYKKQFLSDISYSALNEVMSQRDPATVPVFLPYLTGVNSPEYDKQDSGVFFGIKAYHDRFDLVLSIMQGVACLLRKNLDYLTASGVKINRIISTGGGSKSPIWTQLKADITGYPIDVPENSEAPCLGAAIMASISEGYFPNYQTAITASVHIKKTYLPSNQPKRQQHYELFTKVYENLKNCHPV